MGYIVKDIQWNTNGNEKAFDFLPQEIALPENFSKEKYKDEDEMIKDISDWISDEYGFCHEGFTLLGL